MKDEHRSRDVLALLGAILKLSCIYKWLIKQFVLLTKEVMFGDEILWLLGHPKILMKGPENLGQFRFSCRTMLGT